MKKTVNKIIVALGVVSFFGMISSQGTYAATPHKKTITHKSAKKKQAQKIRVFRRGKKIYVTGITNAQKKRFLDVIRAHQSITTAFGSPAASIGAPNAFGSTRPSVFASATYVNHWARTTDNDGLMTVGASFGNPYKYIGVTFSSTLTSLGINNSPFASNGTLGLRLNRYFNRHTAIAFGVGVLHGWGVSRHVANSYYGALTHAFHLGLPMTVNVGIGTGSFHSSGDSRDDRDNHLSGFFGLGVSVYKGLSVIMDYATESLNFGGTYSFSIGRRMSAFVSAAGKNINKHNGKAYFQANGGVSFNFK